LDLPLSRFPLRGKAGAGGFPPRRKHVARQQKALALAAHPAPPARGAQPPLRIPPEPVFDGTLGVTSFL
jgi:hypothetical protein